MNSPMHIGLPSPTIWRWLLLWTITCYVTLCLVLFALYVKPSFLGQNDLRIGADSYTYLVTAGVLHDSAIASDTFPLVSFGANFLGPVLVARLIPSLAGIALLNLTICRS